QAVDRLTRSSRARRRGAALYRQVAIARASLYRRALREDIPLQKSSRSPALHAGPQVGRRSGTLTRENPTEFRGGQVIILVKRQFFLQLLQFLSFAWAELRLFRRASAPMIALSSSADLPSTSFVVVIGHYDAKRLRSGQASAAGGNDPPAAH